MNRRTGNIRRKKPKRRYHDRRQEPKGIEVSAVQGEAYDPGSMTMHVLERCDFRDDLEKAHADANAERIAHAAVVAEYKAKLQDAEARAITADMGRARCACGAHMPSHASGVAWVCLCGRRYEAPTIDSWRVIERIRELETRIEKLESVIRTSAGS